DVARPEMRIGAFEQFAQPRADIASSSGDEDGLHRDARGRGAVYRLVLFIVRARGQSRPSVDILALLLGPVDARGKGAREENAAKTRRDRALGEFRHRGAMERSAG